MNKSEKWSKLKSLIFSKEKLVFLSKINNKELNIFEKTYSKDKSEVVIKGFNINGINSKHSISKDNNLANEIVLKKPILTGENINSEEYLKKLDQEIIDNTGIIDIWPSEEILSLYLFINKDLLTNKSVLELGSGYSGLAGIIITQNSKCDYVNITDGNSESIKHLNNITLSDNKLQSEKRINAEVLLWDRNKDFTNSKLYDFVIISDCLFFVKYHLDLAITIKNSLKANGKCIIITPKRGNTMIDFITIAKSCDLKVEINNDAILSDLLLDNSSYSSNLIILTN